MKKVFITGDIAIDWFEIIKQPEASVSDMDKENWKRYNNIVRIPRPGGALLMTELMQSFKDYDVVGPKLLKECREIFPEEVILSEALLKYNEQFKTHFISDTKGFQGPSNGAKPDCLSTNSKIINYPKDAKESSLIIIDDSGNGFRNAKSFFPQNIGEDVFVIYKMFRPLIEGSLYGSINDKVKSENIITIISADDLRKINGVNISHGLSWERSAKDFVYHINLNKELMELSKCANLIVLFNTDGAILYKGKEGGKSTLFFDPKRLENGFLQEHPYKVMGITSVFSSFIADSVLRKGIAGIEEGIVNGLKGARLHNLCGYKVNTGGIEISLKTIRDLNYQSDDNIKRFITNFSQVEIPKPTVLNNPDPDYWTILDQMTSNSRDLIAENIVRKGEDTTLEKVPEIQFGDRLKPIDRREIESYSGIQKLIREYLVNKKPEHPLCIAVFGSPGSGKSFAVKQIAERIDRESIRIATFNLSQFENYKELAIAFHKTRDICLSGKVPLVFFDEFDSNNLEWVKYFLAPMQDGVFVDGESEYHIGKAIFVFAGGTCDTFSKFANIIDEDSEKAKTLKVNDFISRLRGFIDIMGPNKRTNNGNTQDESYIIRRARLIRDAFINFDSAKELFDNDKKTLNIDDGVLRALLKVPSYKHGNRSIKAILQMSRLAGQKVFDCALLPPNEQLNLHVDADLFHFLIEKERFTTSREDENKIVENLARSIHETYINNRKIKKEKVGVSEEYDKLSEEKKFSNIDQAEDTPRKLKSIGLGFRTFKKPEYPNITIITDKEIESLAKMEHERWCREQKLKGWSYGKEKNISLKLTPHLIFYDKLSPDIKEYSREAVVAIPMILKKEGYELYRMEEKEEITDDALMEKLARVIHQKYVEMRKEEGKKVEDDLSLKPYDELSDDLKFSNINSAYNIPSKLIKIGYAIRLLKQGESPEIEKFSKDEIETMAHLEHERWNWERLINGWTYGKKRDDVNKTSPYIVSYDKLPDNIKEYDRISVRLIPELLNTVEYEIYKLL